MSGTTNHDIINVQKIGIVDMYCQKCGFEITDKKAKVCPSCQTKIKHDSFPVWLIILLVFLVSGFFFLPVVGIVAAITMPTLIMSTNRAKNKATFLKTYVTLNQSMLMDKAISDKSYTKFEDVWNKSIKNQLLNPEDIEHGIRLKDLTEIKYTKLNDNCKSIHEVKEISDRTACAVLTIDTDGFNKGKNRQSENNDIQDQFKILLYSDTITTIPNSIENKLTNGRPTKE